MAGAIRRVPAIADAPVTRMINGPEGFTPDNEFILGESDVRGLFVAAGFCAHGIAGAGGIGRQVASWIVEGEPELDLWKMDIRRFGPQYRSRSYTLARSVENYATYYDIHYPNEERQAGRPLRVSPAYARLAALGASFGEKASWERANWFEPNAGGAGVATAAGLETLRPRGWAGEHWSPAIGAEALATRTTAGLFDETSFAKIEVVGPGAAALLQWLCANDVDRAVGSVTYTQLLNRRGGIECDLTVTRVTPDRFLLVTGTAFGNHDLGWIRRHAPRDGSVLINDLTPGRACYGAVGAARPRHPGLDDDRRRVRRRVPVPHGPRDHGRRRARDTRCASRTSASSAGSCTRTPSTARPSGTRYGPRARRTARSRAGTGRSTPCGSRRATAPGPPTSRPRRRRTRPASASPSPWTGGDFLGRDALVAARAAGPPSACAASCSTTLARSASATSPSASRDGSPAA